MNKTNQPPRNPGRFSPLVSVLLTTYKSERYIDRYIEAMLCQSMLDRLELVWIANDPSPSELNAMERIRGLMNVKELCVPRENLYRSFNRGINVAESDFLAHWNVDDYRHPDSLERQYSHIIERKLFWNYGSFYMVSTHEDRQKRSRLIHPPSSSDPLGLTGSIGGPFFMFSKHISSEIGYYDEQFETGGDFDFTVRLSKYGLGEKVPGEPLGNFLNIGEGMSTSQPLRRDLECTAIQLRHGIVKNLDLTLVWKAKRNYDLATIHALYGTTQYAYKITPYFNIYNALFSVKRAIVHIIHMIIKIRSKC